MRLQILGDPNLMAQLRQVSFSIPTTHLFSYNVQAPL